MKIFMSFLCLMGLFSLCFAVDAYGHGNESGSWRYVGSFFDHCVTPSITVVKKVYKRSALYKNPYRALPPGYYAHLHTRFEYATVRPYSSGYNSDCDTYREVCKWVERIESTSCHKSDMSTYYCRKAKSRADWTSIEGDWYTFYKRVERRECKEVLIMP